MASALSWHSQLPRYRKQYHHPCRNKGDKWKGHLQGAVKRARKTGLLPRTRVQRNSGEGSARCLARGWGWSQEATALPFRHQPLVLEEWFCCCVPVCVLPDYREESGKEKVVSPLLKGAERNRAGAVNPHTYQSCSFIVPSSCSHGGSTRLEGGANS